MEEVGLRGVVESRVATAWMHMHKNPLGRDKDFLEEHRDASKYSGKYAPQPQQTELIWTMPWGCWVELEDKDVHCKEWECIIENFTEEEANATVH